MPWIPEGSLEELPEEWELEELKEGEQIAESAALYLIIGIALLVLLYLCVLYLLFTQLSVNSL